MPPLPVPYIQPLSLCFGSCVIIRGRPNLSFVNDPQLQVDFCTDMDGDSGIAFHFRVYFGHCVVMNSRECEVWKWEEKSDHVPFQDGMPFEVHIYVRHDEYQVTINGERVYGFGHRLPPSSVKMMRVWRDVSLSSVSVYY
uniref:Galectin n=1 Tax=Ateles fusciceps TaxID=9508 RepID=C5HZ22_ATEFU|nr:galectin-20 precursor [Ateles fusciceps]